MNNKNIALSFIRYKRKVKLKKVGFKEEYVYFLTKNEENTYRMLTLIILYIRF